MDSEDIIKAREQAAQEMFRDNRIHASVGRRTSDDTLSVGVQGRRPQPIPGRRDPVNAIEYPADQSEVDALLLEVRKLWDDKKLGSANIVFSGEIDAAKKGIAPTNG